MVSAQSTYKHQKSSTIRYSKVQLLFSLKGLAFCELKPTSKQSSCSCSAMNLVMSATAWDTVILFIAASLLSCSTICLCCCKVEIIISITAVSERPILKGVVTQNCRKLHLLLTRLKHTQSVTNYASNATICGRTLSSIRAQRTAGRRLYF